MSEKQIEIIDTINSETDWEMFHSTELNKWVLIHTWYPKEKHFDTFHEAVAYAQEN